MVIVLRTVKDQGQEQPVYAVRSCCSVEIQGPLQAEPIDRGDERAGVGLHQVIILLTPTSVDRS